MTQISIHDWEFVGCSRRLGTVTRVGPRTGKNWSIPITGTWIDAEDAEILSDRKEKMWCFRTNSYVDIFTVFVLNPTVDQLKLKPNKEI